MSLHDFSFRRHVVAALPDVVAHPRSEGDDAVDAMEALLLRLTVIRRLREHHVWEAVRLLRDRPDLTIGDWPSRRFKELMAADALVDAVLHLTSATEAKLCLRTLSHELGLWTCALRYQRPDAGRVTFKVRHADLAAAILGAFLRACRDHPTVANTRGHLPS